MHVLYFHQHFSTPKGATGIRSYQMAQKLLSKGHRVTMVCGSYGGGQTGLHSDFQSGRREGNVDGIGIIEFDLAYSNADGFVKRALTFLTFALKSIGIAMRYDYDMVFATSSRLFTAFLGARISKSKRVPLYLDIRDIFVDTIKDVLPSKITWLAKPVLSAIERYTFSQASCINLVSEGFKDYFVQRYPDVDYRWFTNGIDKEFLSASTNLENNASSEDKVTVLYAGNIGEGQGLHVILPYLQPTNTIPGAAAWSSLQLGTFAQRSEPSLSILWPRVAMPLA